MSVDTVTFDWTLEQSQILDFFILQWHTPLLTGNSKIPSAIVIEKTAILKEFRDWLINYFIVSETSSRPIFIIAPELSLPFVCDSLICEIVTGMKRPVTFIAGLEYLQWSEYKDVLEHKSNMPHRQEWLKGNNVGAHVNAAGIWMSSGSKKLQRFIQPKREPSTQEGASIFCPDRYLLFVSKDQTSGRRLNFCVQICSDFSSDDKVRDFRQSLAPALTSELDITFLLQCNEDQNEERFRSAVKTYFAAPTSVGMVKTSDGCLLFINNANPMLGKSEKFGKSAFHFEYTKKWDDPLVDPQPTYFARNNNANNYHELGLRESGPTFYHLTYKPRYTLTISRGGGDELPFHCNRACCAFIEKDSFINGKRDSDVFEFLTPKKYWLRTEWDEGIRILEQVLKTDHIPTDIIDAIKGICYYCAKEWIGMLDEKLIEKLLGKYLILWKKEGFPSKNPEPITWLNSVSRSVNKFLETYALLVFGTQSLSPKNLQIDTSLDYHALLDDINICFMWGGTERTVQGIISEFLSELKDTIMVMRNGKILLIIVEPRSAIDKNSMDQVIEKAIKQITEPEVLPGEQHFVSGEVTSEKISLDFKGLCGAELEKNINTSANRNEFEAKLLEVVKGANIMSNLDIDFSKIIDSREWKISLSEEEKAQGFSAICESVYAVAGIIVLPDIKQALSSWTEFQGLMLNYRNQAGGSIKKDLYLIFIVPFIEAPQLGAIEAMINDTHVCRKICIEQKGRSLREALNDCGFITTVPNILDSSERDLSNQALNQGLSEEILNDLRTRSEKTVFEKLLDNSYYK